MYNLALLASLYCDINSVITDIILWIADILLNILK